MTEKANPSPNRPADPFKTAGAIAYGGIVDGFIVDAAAPTEISTQDAEIDETAFNNFAESSSGTSLTVSIAPGEGFVFGSWLAIDVATSVTLSASTTGQTVYFGWNKDTADDVIIGVASDFSSLSSDADKKIPLYDFDTDGSGVTSATDRRQIGRAQDLSALAVADELGLPVYSDTANAPQTEGSVIAIDGSGSESVGIYSYDGTTYVKAGKTQEAIEDIVAGLITGGSAISVSYDDANDTLTINNDEPYTDEDAEDAIATALSGGNNVSITYDGPNDTIIVDTSALNSEEVEDQVNSLINAGNAITTSYDDANNTLTISVDESAVGVDVSDNGTTSVSNSTDINFSDGNKVSDDGDSTVTINVEPADFAGSGLQDDGTDNLELINDSLTVGSGDGLKNGGLVSLGGSTTLDIEPNDFAGSGLQDDGADNLEVVRSPIEDSLKFGQEGSTTTSTSYVVIDESDIAVDFSDYRNINGNLEIRVLYHISNLTGGETTTISLFRQNAATQVTGTEVSYTPSTGDTWTVQDTGWIDFSNESGFESYQIQMKCSAGEAKYNSVILQMRT